MRISTKSWHYRLLRLVGMDPPQSLCWYFWAVAICAPTVIVWWTLVGIVLAVLGAGPIARFFVGGDVGTWALVGGVIDIVALIVVLVALLNNRWDTERHERFLREGYQPQQIRKPSLLRAWIRAKHEKVCPVLEFERS